MFNVIIEIKFQKRNMNNIEYKSVNLKGIYIIYILTFLIQIIFF